MPPSGSGSQSGGAPPQHGNTWIMPGPQSPAPPVPVAVLAPPVAPVPPEAPLPEAPVPEAPDPEASLPEAPEAPVPPAVVSFWVSLPHAAVRASPMTRGRSAFMARRPSNAHTRADGA